MFTGIVEEIGTVKGIDLADPHRGLEVRATKTVSDTRVGDSIAVNGVCLTVTEFAADGFAVGVMPETLRRTALGRLVPGDTVNLERALRPDSRLGGHFVQGHSDGQGTVARVEPDGSSISIRIETSPEILRYVVEKGFIAVDGISLTVTGVNDQAFSVALVRYTQDHIASGLLKPGHIVNLEVDVLAKYVEKLVIH